MPKDCFIICPIDSEGSEVRSRSDKLFKHLFKPVLEGLGYNPIRADQIDEVGNITSQIIDLLVEAPLVIADLSGHNPNVFYELGIRHTIRKPYIQFIAKGDRLPFDVAPIRSIVIDHTDLDSVESAKKSLKNQIRAYEQGAHVYSPVSVENMKNFMEIKPSAYEEAYENFVKLLCYAIGRYNGYVSNLSPNERKYTKVGVLEQMNEVKGRKMQLLSVCGEHVRTIILDAGSDWLNDIYSFGKTAPLIEQRLSEEAFRDRS